MGKLVSSVANIFTGADDTKAAGERASAAQAQAAREGAAAAAFRPVGMTTRFGSSQFTRSVDPATGMPYISSAGYTAAPELEALQNQLFGQFGGGYDFASQQAQQLQALSPASQQLFGLGQEYLATTPEQARQDYIRTQQAALAPGREQQRAGLRNQMFQTGRQGLATGGTMAGGMQATNPELAAYYNALAQQQAQLTAGANQAAQQQQAFGAGLFGQGAGLLGQQSALTAGAYAPLQTQLGLAGSVEGLGQQALELGSGIGGRAATAGAAAGNLLSSGMGGASRTLAGITDPNAALLGSLGRQIGTTNFASSPSSNWFDNLIGNPSTANQYGTDRGSQQTRMLAAQDYGF